MAFMDKIQKFLPERFRKKKDPTAGLKENRTKEKENIKTSFAVYCNANHDTKDGKLCPKCTALLTTVLLKFGRCKYGVTKPLCDHCDEKCFGEAANKTFMKIMDGSRNKMLLRHPIMTVRHKITGMGVEYAKQKQNDAATQKEEGRLKAKAAKVRKRRARKNPK